MATMRKQSSLAARKMRMAISLRLAASSLRIGLVFFISEAIDASCEILHCFILATRPRCSFSNLENQLFFWTVRGDAQKNNWFSKLEKLQRCRVANMKIGRAHV